MEIEVEITRQDELALALYAFKKDNSLGSKTFLILCAAIVLTGAILIIIACAKNNVAFGTTVSIVAALIIIIAFYILLPFFGKKLWLFSSILNLKFVPRKTAKPDKRTYKISPEGLTGISNYGAVDIKRGEIKKTDITDKYIFISSDKYGIHIIPKRHFSSPAEAEKFAQSLHV